MLMLVLLWGKEAFISCTFCLKKLFMLMCLIALPSPRVFPVRVSGGKKKKNLQTNDGSAILFHVSIVKCVQFIHSKSD